MRKFSFRKVRASGRTLTFIVGVACIALLAVAMFLHYSELPETVDELHWMIGDMWVYSGEVSGMGGGTLDRILIEEVVGEERINGKDCYVEIITLEPYGVLYFDASVKYFKLWVEKDTLKVKQAFLLSEENFPIITISYTNDFAQKPFPLEIGKEFEYNISARRDVFWGEYPPQESSSKFISVVHAKENIEIDNETFECFMISQYENDIGGAPIGEWAYSPEVLNVVRSHNSLAIIASRNLVYYELEPRLGMSSYEF